MLASTTRNFATEPVNTRALDVPKFAVVKAGCGFLDLVHCALQITASEHDAAFFTRFDHCIGICETRRDRFFRGDAFDTGFGAGNHSVFHIFGRCNNNSNIRHDVMQ